MTNSQGKKCSAGSEIAEIFAVFYEKLYLSERRYETGLSSNPCAATPVSLQELQAVLLKMKNNRSCADDGLLAEMLKSCSDDMLSVVAHLVS